MASNVTTFKQLHLADGAVLFVAEQDVAKALPAGFIQLYGGSTAPDGWLSCDGSSLLRASYPDLFAVIGTSFGAVDATHFTLPNLQGKFPLGANGAGAEALGTAGGAATHSHGLSSAGWADISLAAIAAPNVFINRVAASAWTPNFAVTAGTTVGANSTGQTTGAALGGSTDASVKDTNYPPFVALTYIIKT